MAVSDSAFFQWFTDNKAPEFFNEEHEELTLYLSGFAMTLFTLLLFGPLFYRLIKVILMPKTTVPQTISWLFIFRIVPMVVIFMICLARAVIPLCYGLMNSTIYKQTDIKYYDPEEGIAYYLIIPNFLLCLDWLIVMVDFYFERQRSVFFGTFVQIFILGQMFIHLLFIGTVTSSDSHRTFINLINILFIVIYWIEVVASLILSFSMLFKQDNRFINPEYKRVVSSNKEERDADRSNSQEENNDGGDIYGSSIHFTPMSNTSVSQSYQNDTLGLLRNNQPVDSRAKPQRSFFEKVKHFIDFITFSNIKEILGFKRGYQKGMTMDVSDIDQLDIKNRSNYLVRQFEVAWEKAKEKTKPKLLRVMFKLNGKAMLIAIIPRLIFDITMFIPIVAQTIMIRMGSQWHSYQDGSSYSTTVFESASSEDLDWRYSRSAGMLFGVLVTIIAIISSVSGHYFNYITTLVGQKMRSTLIMAMYERIFSMNAKSLSTTPHGQILNMMSVDANCVNDMCSQVHLLWSCSLEVIISIVWLFCVVQWSAFAGLIIMFLAVFANVVLARFIVRQMRKLMIIKDTRVKLLTEVLNAIKTVKVMVWESHLHGQLHETRKKEVRHILFVIAFRSCMNFIVWAIPPSVSFVTYGIITIIAGGDSGALKPMDAFITLGLFNIMRLPLIRFPKLLNDTMQGVTSMRRIQEFLLKGEDQKDRDADNVIVAVEPASPDSPVIAVEHASYTWEDNDSIALSDINFTAQKGQLIGIIGEVGCGKTAFFKSLLGNLHKTNGMALYNGKIGYVAQNAWVQNLTVHDNVVFGKKHDNDLYEKVVAACELRNDLENFPGADQMEVGIGGSNLSGGQKQRLALARATYQNADIYLLDDCLSAVDANVGQNIFTNCIKGVLSEKTRILITQTFQYLPECDYIYVMKNGTFIEKGTFEELKANQNSEFSRLYSNYVANVSHGDEHGKRILKRKVKKGMKASQLIAKENTQTYAGFGTMLTYIKYGGWVYFTFVMLFFFISSFLLIGSNFWLVIWTDEEKKNNSAFFRELNGYELVGSYGLIVFVVLIFIIIRFISLGAFNGKASINLHFDALNRVLNSPMSFFQATPIGRILNRFSENLFVIDDKINLSLAQFISSVTLSIVTVIITSISCDMMLGVFALSIYWFFYVFNWYMTYAKQLLRLDMVYRSPLYNTFQETLLGLDTIRIMKNNHRFTSILSEKLNKQQKIYYATNVCQRWLGMRVELIGCVGLGAVVIFSSMRISSISPSLIALLILYMFQFNNILNQLIQSSVEVQTQSTAIQAVCEYLTLPSERGIKETDPTVTGHVPDNWPEAGDVQFQNVTMTYNPDLPPAVNELTIHVRPGESVGIVGRTGAGKSSIMVTLFRLYEMTSGRIIIDGVDTSTLALETLRSRLCVIPQEPVLFRGTLRKNLDILGKHTDEELIQALDDVNIREHIFSKGNGLETEIAEGGSNFSIGERQLICLARGLLSRSKVIVLDEATANVDLQTEKRIFNALFTHCKGSTMFMIAHRLHTILTCDKILMLEKGRVLGFGAPEELKKTCPEFAALVSKTGFDIEEGNEEKKEEKLIDIEPPTEKNEQKDDHPSTQQPSIL
ncbi:hypothetical protein ENUP19_0252G0038 [Entamoeba nuttalli]|uniref:Multidrug resistance protein, putative n=2 Tax=Entamoeba nuttalli TaxID=412467 RepID=K2GZB5_ENTNP|nr:multidrug resistance protein, putative [Entamoeba nuttalli P19]EKE39242.1 multidrug resistance protein, putative [Entamoeba nuttalli P19]|eukprot:XP_008858439.1 multidrug resistance protein, putative [Entamoeba nuttalli P19]